MEKYETVEIELVFFDSCDIVCGSKGDGDIPLDPAERLELEEI